MYEALRNIAVLVWAMTAVNTNADAQYNEIVVAEKIDPNPVVVFGEAKNKSGGENVAIVEQPNEENPLGNPIPNPDDLTTIPDETVTNSSPERINIPSKKIVNQISENNPPISSENSPQKVNQEIQDTLYESGGRIYDIQSYPESDINTIEEPNINPTITNYPAY